MKKTEHTIDAEGQTIGRVASQAAELLRGKDSADFERNLVCGAKVTVVNASKIKVINNKLGTIYHKHYSGYPGGMKFEMNDVVAAKKGYRELIRLAVHGMLPDNKLKPLFMKNLTISE